MAFIGALIVIGSAGAFAYAGLSMTSLQSQAGNTVAEAFYQAMGIFSYGMAGLVLVVGLGIDRLQKLAPWPRSGEQRVEGPTQPPAQA